MALGGVGLSDDHTTDTGRAPRRPRLERAWIVIAGVLLVAVALGLVGAIQVPERRDDMWFEIFASAIRVIVLAITGGVVAAVLRDRDAAREDARRRQANAAAFLEQIAGTYNQVKSVRRMLRTHGFGSPAPQTLTSEQTLGFRTEMALLNDAELAYEMHARKVALLPGPYEGSRDELVRELTDVHDYLKGVLRDWQVDPGAIAPDRDPSAIQGWAAFQRFVGYDDASMADFRGGIADRMVTIEVLIAAASAVLGARSTGPPAEHPVA